MEQWSKSRTDNDTAPQPKKAKDNKFIVQDKPQTNIVKKKASPKSVSKGKASPKTADPPEYSEDEQETPTFTDKPLT